jgi:lysophospholipase L1-like esterase
MKSPEVLTKTAFLLAGYGLLGGCAVQNTEQAPSIVVKAPGIESEDGVESTVFIPVNEDIGPIATASTIAVEVDASDSSSDEHEEVITAVDCSDNPIIVFGNSTDSVTGVNIEDMKHAWPAILQEELSKNPNLVGIAVLNNAKPGVTMDYPNPWSDEAKQRWTADIPQVFSGYTPEELQKAIIILSPSIIDLQLQNGDVQKTLDGFLKAYNMLKELGVGTVITLPMNPIVDDSLMKYTYPWMPEKMQEFNDQLGSLKLYETSPLAISGTKPSVGDSQYYDDFAGLGLHGEIVEPDGLHPDQDGGRRIAEVLAEDENVPSILRGTCNII